MRVLQLLILMITLTGTISLFAQSQETRDAVQDYRLSQVEGKVDAHTAQLSIVLDKMATFQGALLGIGSLLSVLQIAQVVISVRKK